MLGDFVTTISVVFVFHSTSISNSIIVVAVAAVTAVAAAAFFSTYQCSIFLLQYISGDDFYKHQPSVRLL